MPAKKAIKAPAKKSAGKSAAKSAQPASTDASVYQLKVTLKGFKPAIWRRILVKSDDTLGTLHVIVQMVMGWSGGHMHQFILGKRPNFLFIGSPVGFDDGEMENEDEVTVNQVLPVVKTKMIYEYDFGDGWEHEIALEKTVPAEKGIYYPQCLAGENACPPDDVGGVWGYDNFLKAIKDPKHPEHEELLEWSGGDFDPQEFDLADVNKRLKNLKRKIAFERELRDLFS
ncbi:MAG: plasmid pRiA4b ORF-3 family protein [Blastocatellia bacterium]